MSKIVLEPKPTLSKIVFEFRFRPNLNYFSDAFKIASALEGDFDDWRTSHSPYQAVLYSTDKMELMSITSENIAVVLEGDYSNDTLFKRLEKAMQLLVIPTELQEIRRIGVRQIRVHETNADFDKVTTKLAEAFSSNYDKHEELALDKVKDYAFVLDGIKNGFTNHIRFGAVKPEEGVKRFGSSFSTTSKHVTKDSVLLDIDVFNDELNDVDGLQNSIHPIVEEADRIVKGYTKLITQEL